MSSDSSSTVGQRIAQGRQRMGMSRQVLAGLIGRSPEWLRQIENGTRTLDSIRMATGIAQILGYDHLDELIEVEWAPRRSDGQQVISARLRNELAKPGCADTATDIDDPDTAEHLARLRHVWWNSPDRVIALDRGLTRLIPQARRHRWNQRHDEAAEAGNVEVLGLARSYLTFVGERHLALAIAERAVAQSEESSPLLRAVAVRGLALCYLQNKQFGVALSLAKAAGHHLDTNAPIVGGALWCVAAKAAAHLHDREVAAAMLARARDRAQARDEDSHVHGVWFGAGELALTEMAVAWSIGAHDQVLATASRSQAYLAMPMHFRIPFHALMATLYARRGDVGTAVAQLREIESLSPEAVVYNRMVHAALRSLAGTSHPLFSRDVRRLAALARL